MRTIRRARKVSKNDLQTGEQPHMSENSNPNVKSENESRRAEVIEQILSDVLHLHLIEFRQYKVRWNFRFSNFENTRHVIYLGVT